MTATRLFLGPGASGGIDQLEPYQAGLADRGIPVHLVPLPRGSAERAVPVFQAAVGPIGADTVMGGHSFGGRVASLVAAASPPAGLVLLSYPLHAPGRHEAWDARTAHWPDISCPVLLLSGEADPFARLDLLRTAVERLPNAELVTYPRLGHGLWRVLDDALDRITAFCERRT